MQLVRLLVASMIAAAAAPAAFAEVPYPKCQAPGCTDPSRYSSYLFLPPGVLPNDFDPKSSDFWKFNPGTGMNIVGAWQRTTGRPDVVVAVLDSGIRWNASQLAKATALNTGELPLPPGCTEYDCNDDGVVNVEDYPMGPSPQVPDANGNGFLDGQDLIRRYQDSVDDDGNGFVDDIAGWDFYQNDNDPSDDVEYGHGTGEASDQVEEANDSGGFPGVAPSSRFMPCRVADSFVAIDTDFAQAVIYAVDRHVSVISEALGAITASMGSQHAIDYAYRRGIPIIASAADEQSRHHNYPANFEHTLWVNSIRNGDGTFVEEKTDYTVQNGCTNHGGRAWAAISSTSCSSEATGRSGGIALLLVSHGRNLMDRGLLAPYPGNDATHPFSAEEVRQLFRASATDVDHSANPFLTVNNLLGFFLSAPDLDLYFESSQFGTQAGWDEFTGYGRPDVAQLLDLAATAIPPEADLSGSLRWFDTIDPVRTPNVPVVGTAAAMRTGGAFNYVVEVGCGVQPTSFTTIGGAFSVTKRTKAALASWSPAATAAACGFDPTQPIEDPDAHTVTLRLRVIDTQGRLGEDRRTVAIHSDPTLHFAPKFLGASGEGSPALADVDRDGILEIVYGTTDGLVHVLRGATGAELPGFPAQTDLLPVHASPAYLSGEVPPPREAILAPVAADDIDGDGHVEIVAASTEGRLYVFDDHGRRRPGFPVATNPAFSLPANRDPYNDADPAIVSAPTLADLDGPGGNPDLEILHGGWDGHLYAWRADGTPVAGFPVRLGDRSQLDIDPVSGKATLKSGSKAKERLTKILSSPAVGDLDRDGFPEIVLGTNEEYGGEANGFFAASKLLKQLTQLSANGLDVGDFALDTGARVYTVHHDGNLHAGGPFRAGWPVKVPMIVGGLLPTVAAGVPGAPALADLDGSGKLTVAIFGAVGPVLLLDADGNPTLGRTLGVPNVLAVDFPNSFPDVPGTAGSPDAPFFGALGSGAFGDLDGDGKPEYVAPTGGIRTLIDIAAPGSQEFGDHQVSAWNPRTGAVLPAFPRVVDDMQFLSSPGLADVDGDGHADVLQGSGGYLVRAYRSDGTTPAGWPKFTHGWIIPSPTAGDVDGDGKIEIVAATREGNLYVWDTPAPATDAAIPWQGFGRDRRNSGNLSSGVSPMATSGDAKQGLLWALESLGLTLDERMASGPASLRKSGARAAIDWAIFAFTNLNVSLGAAILPYIDRTLALPPANAPLLQDLRAALGAAVSRTGRLALARKTCGAGDTACESARRRAKTWLDMGDQLALRGRTTSAVTAWAASLPYLL
jgi:hypothetical protein